MLGCCCERDIFKHRDILRLTTSTPVIKRPSHYDQMPLPQPGPVPGMGGPVTSEVNDRSRLPLRLWRRHLLCPPTTGNRKKSKWSHHWTLQEHWPNMPIKVSWWVGWIINSVAADLRKICQLCI